MFKIEKLNEYREDNRFEIKKAQHGLPNSLWDTYSSFANCYGGVIVLGIAENKDGSWKSTGLNDEARLRKEFWDTLNNRSKVSINLLQDDSVEMHNDNGNVIMVIHVPKAKREQKPVFINDDIFSGSFRRNWEGDYHCTKSEVLAMLRDQPEDTADMKVLDNVDIEKLDMESVHGYRNSHKSYRPGHAWEKYDDYKYLEMLEAVGTSEKDGKLHPTGAGLLMFGQDYQIHKEFGNYFLDFQEVLDPAIRWTNRFTSQDGEWPGNLFEFFYKVYNKLIQDVKRPFKLEREIRVDDTPVHKAIREALANCLINADYYGRCGIVVRKMQDTIVIENPGDIRLGKHQMRKGGMSDPRNKTLMKMFNMINIGERAGGGVPDIYAVWDSENWKEPIIEERYNPDRTILTLSFEKTLTKSDDKKAAIKSDDKKATIKISAKTKKQYAEILGFMTDEKEYKLNDFEELLNVRATRIKELLKGLINQDKVETIGENRNRRYKLKKQYNKRNN